MPKVNVMAKKKNEQQLADILLLLISIESFVTFEFAPNICQLLVYPLDFCLLAFA